MWLFILLSILYVLSLALIDALVNRLIFREFYSYSYFSNEKKQIYKRKEWVMYCFLFLIFLPIMFPVGIAYLIGGIKNILIYILILAVVDWDIIFGKLVFNNWFGDLPSICLPKIGWIHFKLLPTIIFRILVIIVVLASLYIL